MGLFKKKQPNDLTITMKNGNVKIEFNNDKPEQSGASLGRLVLALSYQLAQDSNLSFDEYTQLLNESLHNLDDIMTQGENTHE